MKRMELFILIGMFLASAPLRSQDHVILDFNIPRYIQLGDQYYTPTYRGLKSYMKDIAQVNPELHAKLLPEFRIMEKKRNTALVSFIAGEAVGSTLIIGGVTFLSRTDNFSMPENAIFRREIRKPNIAAIGIGSLISAAGVLIAVINFPGEDDFNDFVNLHNRNNPEQKMEWKVGFNYIPNQVMGVCLNMRF